MSTLMNKCKVSCFSSANVCLEEQSSAHLSGALFSILIPGGFLKPTLQKKVLLVYILIERHAIDLKSKVRYCQPHINFNGATALEFDFVPLHYWHNSYLSIHQANFHSNWESNTILWLCLIWNQNQWLDVINFILLSKKSYFKR